MEQGGSHTCAISLEEEYQTTSNDRNGGKEEKESDEQILCATGGGGGGAVLSQDLYDDEIMDSITGQKEKLRRCAMSRLSQALFAPTYWDLEVVESQEASGKWHLPRWRGAQDDDDKGQHDVNQQQFDKN